MHKSPNSHGRRRLGKKQIEEGLGVLPEEQISCFTWYRGILLGTDFKDGMQCLGVCMSAAFLC